MITCATAFLFFAVSSAEAARKTRRRTLTEAIALLAPAQRMAGLRHPTLGTAVRSTAKNRLSQLGSPALSFRFCSSVLSYYGLAQLS